MKRGCLAASTALAAFIVLAMFVVACGNGDAREGARSPAAQDANGSDVLRVDTGLIRGARAGATMSFKGIPYAAAPAGARRWQAPSPATPWSDVRDATHFGDGCVEIELPSGKVKQGSEDCLSLNVWTPIDRGEKKLPVLVYLHGGFNVYGSSRKTVEDHLLYDGESIAARGPAIVVTLNYRLGVFGFLASRELGTRGNFALLDQIAALQWVKQNIAAFGGDPSRVMLFGHSAGAVDACALVASPRAKGLFSSAILHSGNCVATRMEKALEAGGALAQKLGCDQGPDASACMRSKDAYAVAEALAPSYTAGGLHWGPVIDGDIVVDQVWKVIARGDHNHMPVIIGSTADEMTTLLHSIFKKKIETEEDAVATLHEYFGKNEQAIAEHYPVKSFPTPRDAFIAAATDGGHTCPARRTARLFAAKQDEPVRRFFYTHVVDEGSGKQYRAGHSFDVLMLYRPGAFSYFRPTPKENELSDAMVGYWTRFAMTGDPNGAGALEWPETTRSHDFALVLDEPIRATEDVREKECDFWDSLVRE